MTIADGSSPRPGPLPGAEERESQTGGGTGLARAAGINSLGNVASRLLGVLRESVISTRFGASGATSAFDAVSAVPKMVYELLVGGMLSAALVPVLSEYTGEQGEDRRTELDDVMSILLTISLVVFVVVTGSLLLGARWIAPLLVGGFDESLLETTAILLRLIVPSVIIYGISGMLQAYHYARKAFVYPSMGAPAHNLGIIVAVWLLSGRFDIRSLSLSILVGALFQLAVQLPGARGLHLRWRWDWRHPVIRRIGALYAPVILSIVIQNLGVIIDRNLASRTAPEAITWMSKATFLNQLPLGLVSMAISLAVLPTLSQMDAALSPDAFKRTFSRGLRLVIVLIIPAGMGLLLLGKPVIELIFQHGVFTAEDAARSLDALRVYLAGLPFAAIDLPLVFAFYAQKDTRTPVMVGIISVVIYLVIAPLLAFVLEWGFLGLVAANSLQQISHAGIMLVVFARRYGTLRGFGVLRSTAQAGVAAVAMGLVVYGAYRLLGSRVPAGLAGSALLAAIPASLGVGCYLLLARFLGMSDLTAVLGAFARFLPRRSG
ncbi:MAG: murein biosynthesis integral membrane protein MurJ [Chloroflexi bacterium]|nr:murein biosynthesis integral membrane protein MurJ [Chloroflexota bacterium]